MPHRKADPFRRPAPLRNGDRPADRLCLLLVGRRGEEQDAIHHAGRPGVISVEGDPPGRCSADSKETDRLLLAVTLPPDDLDREGARATLRAREPTDRLGDPVGAFDRDHLRFRGNDAWEAARGQGIETFLDPLRKKKNKGGETGLYTRVATLDEVPEGGPPKRFIVLAQRTDAWNRYPVDSIGAVYLIRKAGENQPTAFTDVCPHLGCSVTFQPKDNNFFCPCHQSAFHLDGTLANETPPRGLDELKVEIRNDSEIWVEFKKFRGGTKEQIEIS